jgi:4-hydroxythreonine-4-phosphate dehydrogenase
MGDPAGVGPEVILAALADSAVTEGARFVIYAVREDLESAWAQTGADNPTHAATARAILTCAAGAAAEVRTPEGAIGTGAPLRVGRFDPARSAAALACLRAATADAIAKRIDAIVTGPINKGIFLHGGGPSFPGQSELLAYLTGTERWAMMLAGERLRVVLVTTHLPIAEVSAAITTALIEERARVAFAFLQGPMGIPRPRLGVAALNPHSGDAGLLGDEERRVIAPAVVHLREEGHDVSGPLPADTLFGQAVDGRFDCVLAMYHDQGLIPLKLLEFGRAVNVTLGLPIIRTSPDHGVAYDIAGRGQANPGAMKAAIRLAKRLA